MKKLLTFLVLTVALAAAEPDPAAIVSRYRAAHRAKDLDGLMALVEFSPDTPREIYDLKRATFGAQLSLAITDAKVAPLDEEDRKTLATLSRDFDTTLTPVAKLVIRFDENQQVGPAKNGQVVSFLGIKNGTYRIVTAKKKHA